MKESRKNKDIIHSLNVAIEGIIDTIRTERNMKFHFFCAVLLILIGMFLGASRMELIVLSISVMFVIVTELLNTAIETFVDMISPGYSPLAKRAKDIGAGAVFLAATNSVFVGYLVFHNKINDKFGKFFQLLKGSYANVMVFILIFIVIIVIFLKVVFKKGRPLKGGIPSGHSALGGALFMGIFFLTDDLRVFYLALCLLVLVLQSRVEGRIHTVTETIIGAILGMGITYIFLSLLNI
nr:diacylglycerol kinase [uncultured Cetobacterium sp.]